jgi:tape measure domain-containing protein
MALRLNVLLTATADGLKGELRMTQAEMGKLRQEFDGTKRQSQETGRALDSMGRSSEGLTNRLGGLRGMIAGLGLGLLARDIVSTAAQMQTLETRLRTLTGSEQAVADAQAYLSATSRRLSQDIFALTDGYAKMLPLVNANLLSTQNARSILEGFSNVAAATGASTAQLSQAMFGLSQGLSSGILRAEELNQVTEPLPGLMQALDRAAGLAAGGFRKLVVEGKVTSDFFRETLIVALQEYEGAAEKTSNNVAAAYTRLTNAWTRFKVALAEPIIDPLAGFLDAISAGLENLRVIYPEIAFLLDAIKGDSAETTRSVADGIDAMVNQFAGTSRAAIAPVKELTEEQKKLIKEFGNLRGELVPLLKAQEDYNARLKLINQAEKAGLVSTSEAVALRQNLADAYADQLDPLSAVMEGLAEEARLIELSASEREIQVRLMEIENELRTRGVELTLSQREAIEEELRAIQQRSEQREKEDKAAADALRRLENQASPLAKAFETAAESIQRSFSDAFTSIFRNGRLRFDELGDSIKDIFARMLGEMATLAIARPIIVPMVQQLGSFMGVGQQAINGVTNNLGGSAGGGFGLGQLPGGGLYNSFATGRVGRFLGLSSLVDDGVGGGFAQMTGLGSALGDGFAASPWGILGSLGANALGLGGGIGGTIGGGIGSIAGGAAGSAWLGTLLGSAGGPVGAILGSFLGTALGGLLGNSKPSDKTASFQGLLGSDFLKTEDKADDASRQNRDAMQSAVEAALPAVLGLLDTSLTDMSRFYLDAATGQRDGNRFWLYDTGGENLAGQPASARPEAIASGTFDSAEALLGGIVKAITDQVEGLSAVMQTVLDQVDFSDIESAVNDLQLARVYEELGQVAETVPEAQAAIDAINSQFETLTEFAERYGLALDKVTEAQADALAELESGFIDGLRDQILQLTDPAAAQVAELDKWRAAQIRNAEAIGQANGRVGASSEALAAIQELYAIRLQAITGEVAENVSVLTEATRTLYLDQISAVTAFRDDLARKADDFRRIIDSMNRTQLSLLLDSDLSPLSPQARYQEAERQFEEMARRARLGDQDAAEQLPEIVRAFLEASRAYFGDAQAYNNDFQRGQDVLEETKSVAQRHLTTAEQQLGRLDSQIALLREQLDTERLLVTSFEQAIGILDGIKAALDALGTPAQQGVPSNAGGSGYVYPETGLDAAARNVEAVIDQYRVGKTGGDGISKEQRDAALTAILAELAPEDRAAVGGMLDIDNWSDSDNPFKNLAGYASGGRITGGVAGVDSVPVMTMPDEFVIRSASARRIGFDALEQMNRTGTLPGAGSGGSDLSPLVGAIGQTTDAVMAAGEAQAAATAALADEMAGMKQAVAAQGTQIADLTQKLERRSA